MLQYETNKVRNMLRQEIAMATKGPQKVSRLAKALLANLALPSDAQAVRVGSSYGSEPTALANLKARTAVVFPDRNGGDIQSSEHVTMVFRDPLRNMVQSVGLVAGNVVEYQVSGFVHSSAFAGEWYPEYDGPLEPTTGDNTRVHGDEFYLGVLGESDQYRGFHASQGMSITFNFATVGAGWTSINFELYRLDGKLWRFHENYVVPLVAPHAVVTAVARSGYYAFRITTGAAVAANSADANNQFYLTLNGIAANCPFVWAHKAAPQIAGFKENIKTFTVLGASGMYTNTASPLNRQGKILARELPAKTSWENYLNFDDVANMSQAVVKDSPLGLYSFTKPEGDELGRFRTLVYDSNFGDNDEYLYLLYPEEPYVLIHASITTVAGRDAYFTQTISMEYTTLSMFIEQKIGVANGDDLKVALKLLSAMPQFHDNPFHFSDVWDWIKDTAKDVWGAVKEVAPLAVAAAPLLL